MKWRKTTRTAVPFADAMLTKGLDAKASTAKMTKAAIALKSRADSPPRAMPGNRSWEQVLVQDRPVLISRRDSRYLFYSRRTRNVSVFNTEGKRIWDLFSKPARIRDALNEIALFSDDKKHHMAQAFVELLIDKGFLLTDPSLLRESVRRDLPLPASPKRDDLTSLYLHMTNRCNLQCLYCYNEGYREANAEDNELSLDELFDLIDQASRLSIKSIVFTGGEPLIRKETILAAKHARSLGMRTSCLTNGSLLARKASAVADAFDQVVVSLDSWHEEINKIIRIGAKQKRIIEGIRQLRKTNTRVSIRQVITKYNANTLPGFPDYANRELDCINFLPALCTPNDVEDLGLFEYLPDCNSYRMGIRGFYSALERIRKNTKEDIPSCIPSGRCGAGTGMLSIAANGDVYPCQVLQGHGAPAGNIRDTLLESIWRDSPVLRDFRNNPPSRFIACDSCAVSGLCSLNCRANYSAFAEHQEEYTSVMCDYARIEVEERLWREAQKPVHRKTEQNT